MTKIKHLIACSLLCLSYSCNGQSSLYNLFSEVSDSLITHEVGNDFQKSIKLDTITFFSEKFSEKMVYVNNFERIRESGKDTTLNFRIYFSYLPIVNKDFYSSLHEVAHSNKIRFKFLMINGSIYADKRRDFEEHFELLKELQTDIKISRHKALCIGRNNMPRGYRVTHLCQLQYDEKDRRLYWVFGCIKGLKKTFEHLIYIDPRNGGIVKTNDETSTRSLKRALGFRN